MIILAVAASALLTLIFIVRKRHLEVRGGKRLAYHFFDKSLEFLIPLTIIGSLFLLLSLFVAGTSDKTTIQRLLFFEHLVNVFKWFVSIFKVGALIAAGLLIIFYLLTLTRIPSKHTSRLLPFFKKYQKTVKRVYMVAIILFSFTFFGTQAGEPWAKLRFRINEADKEFAGLRHEVEDAVSQEVAKKLLEKVRDSLPQDYRDDVSEQDQYFLLFSSLRSEYQVFKTNYETRDPEAEILLNTTRPLTRHRVRPARVAANRMAAELVPTRVQIKIAIQSPSVVGESHRTLHLPRSASSTICLKRESERCPRASQPRRKLVPKRSVQQRSL